MRRLRVAVVEAGEPPAALLAQHGSYGAMIAAMLGPAYDYTHHRVFASGPAGELPRAEAYDAMVVSGSACGVHDPLPWIAALAERLRGATGTKLVGLCFGHQLMAQALGGTVARSPRGWGVGLHRYEVAAVEPWMAGARAGETIAAAASHQDQVVEAPPGSRVLARSAFAPHAMLRYTGRPAISVQFHPEFTPGFARALLAGRAWPGLAEEERAAAIASHEGAGDGARVAGWIGAFLDA